MPAESLTAEVRLFLSRRSADTQAKLYEMEAVYTQSQSWKGFSRAFRSWHDSRWAAVDQETPPDVVEKFKAISVDWQKASELCLEQDRPRVFEVIRQQYLIRRALFLWTMGGIEATDPDTYDRFLRDMEKAKRIGDHTYAEALAQQKQQKPTKNKGNRRLKYYLLLNWIPCCLWAFTTDGIAALLNERYPRTGKTLYHPKTISDAWRGLKFYHLRRPLYWGITGQPPRLVPLR